MTMCSTLVDYHLHSTFSPDARSSPAECARAAARRGLRGIVFTEHLEFPASTAGEPGYDPPWVLPATLYRRTVAGLAEIWRGRLGIGLGAELGLEAHNLEGFGRYRAQNNLPFDFVLGSLHAVRGTLVQSPEYTNPLGPAGAAHLYFERLLEGVKRATATRACDAVGHLDLVKRSPTFGPLRLEEHRAQLEEILRIIIDGGLGLEVNTSGYRQPPAEPYPGLDVLKLYRRMGGEIITVGSDSHGAETVGLESGRVLDFIRAAGFGHIALFTRRKPRFEPI